jgi:hypothetical protein
MTFSNEKNCIYCRLTFGEFGAEIESSGGGGGGGGGGIPDIDKHIIGAGGGGGGIVTPMVLVCTMGVIIIGGRKGNATPGAIAFCDGEGSGA